MPTRRMTSASSCERAGERVDGGRVDGKGVCVSVCVCRRVAGWGRPQRPSAPPRQGAGQRRDTDASGPCAGRRPSRAWTGGSITIPAPTDAVSSAARAGIVVCGRQPRAPQKLPTGRRTSGVHGPRLRRGWTTVFQRSSASSADLPTAAPILAQSFLCIFTALRSLSSCKCAKRGVGDVGGFGGEVEG
jgi:hypothetical protein